MKKGLITGSFDPPTRGHLHLIRMAADLFDQLTVCVFINHEKTPMFSPALRCRMLRAMMEEAGLTERVMVDRDDGYVADYAKEHEIDYLVRGIRKEAELSYELEMAVFNRKRTPGLETVFFLALPEEKELSSTVVRERLHQGDWPEDMLMPSTLSILRSLSADI